MDELRGRRRWFRWRLSPSQFLVLGFAALIGIGSILLWMPFSQEPGQERISFVGALFTATSAVCVTGLVVVDTATQWSRTGELVILILIQAGGLGIMTLSTVMFLLLGKRISLSERLMMQQALGSFSMSGVVRLTRNIILATLVIEAVGVLLLTLRWSRELHFRKALYWGVFHSISAFNNAGFDVTSASMQPYNGDPFIMLVILLLFFMGGLGFFVMEEVWRLGTWGKFSLHTRLVLKVTALLVVVASLGYLLLEYNNPATLGPMPWPQKFMNAIFSGMTPRTAGFNTISTGSLLDATLLFTMILMFIGASPGGTGGGIKTTTFTMIALTIRATAMGREDIQVMGRRLPRDMVDKTVTIAAIAMGMVVTVLGLLLLTEAKMLADPASGFTFVQIMFEVVSAFGTVGLSTGITGDLSDLGKVLITVTMFVGRVGPLTLAIALAQRKYARMPINYPEDRVMIG